MFPAYVEVSLSSKVLEFKLLNTLEFTSKHRHILVVIHEHGTRALQLLTKSVDETTIPTLCLGMQSNVVLTFTIPTSLSSLLATLAHVKKQGLNMLVSFSP
jgi:hypothetical protein